MEQRVSDYIADFLVAHGITDVFTVRKSRKIKASDYIVEYLISKGITDAFGYPGGMVTQLMDSFGKYGGVPHDD